MSLKFRMHGFLTHMTGITILFLLTEHCSTTEQNHLEIETHKDICDRRKILG